MSGGSDWTKSTVAELKEALTERDLVTTGLKKELIKRLQDADAGKTEEENTGEANAEEEEINADDVIDDVVNNTDGDENQEAEEDTETKDEVGNCEGADMVEAEEAERAKMDDSNADSENVEANGEEQQEGEEGNEEAEVAQEDLNMEDMVAVDEVAEDGDTHLDEEDADLDIDKLLKCDDDEMLVLPPIPMNKWVIGNFMENRCSCALFINKLTAKDVLGEVMVEWANRARFFGINHDRAGNGHAVLNYSSMAECNEAKEALTAALGEEVTISHITTEVEKDARKGMMYTIESGSIVRNRLVFVEGAPKDITIEEMCAIFDEALLIIKLGHEESTHKWEKLEYIFPEEMQNIFVLEFASAEGVENTLKSQKEIKGEKPTYKVIKEIEEDYKRFHARKLREARDRKWEVLEKKKEEHGDIKEFTLTDDERMKLYRNVSALNRYKNRTINQNTDSNFENKVLQKETIIVKLYETRQKIDGDTNRRVREELMLPEHTRFMTKYTEGEYQKLSKELKDKMAKDAKDPFSSLKPKERGTSRHDRDRHDRGGSSRDRRDGRDRRPDDRHRRDSGRDHGGRGARRDIRGGRPDRRPIPGRDGRESWRSPDRMDPKRRRMDEFDRRRPEESLEVASTLKGLTDVINHKMGEIERLAGGMKARERALEDAYNNISRPMSGGGNYSSMGGGGGGFSGMGSGYSDGGFMTQQSGGFSSGRGGGGRFQGGMSRSGMSGPSMDRRRNIDVDDRFSRY